MTIIIDGKAAATEVISKVKTATEALFAAAKTVPGIAVVIVGDDPASHVYVSSKGRKAKECGFHSVQHTLPPDTSEDRLLDLIDTLNADPAIHGILVQLPLPGGMRTERVIARVAAQKDVDGFHLTNVGKLASGDISTGFVPCTPAGSMILIRRHLGDDLSGLNAVVVGRSNIVGKPMANLLLNANATVTVAHSRSKNLADLCRTADVLVAAVGRPKLIKGTWIKPGATVIDVGINRISLTGPEGGGSALVGDVDFDGSRHLAGAISPVPGGVGPMTIAMLMANTCRAAYMAANVPQRDFLDF